MYPHTYSGITWHVILRAILYIYLIETGNINFCILTVIEKYIENGC